MNFLKFFLLSVFVAVFTLLLTAAPSPWDSWRSGYTNFEKGESLRERGRYSDALKAFENARKNYLSVRSSRPDWNQRVIADRLRDCDRQITELRRLLGSTSAKQTSDIAGSAVEQKEASRGNSVSSSAEQSSSSITGHEGESNQKIVMLERKLLTLHKENQRLQKEIQTQRKFETEIASLLRDRKIADEKYALLEKRFASLQNELNRPNERMVSLEQQVVGERMNSERLARQIASLEQQLKIEKEQGRLNIAAKKALEDVLKKRDEQLRRNQQLTKETVSDNQEIMNLKKRISILQSKIDEFVSKEEDVNEAEKSLPNRKRISFLNEEIASLRSERDSALISLRDMENKKNQLISENSILHTDLEQARNSAKLNSAELVSLRERNAKLEDDIKILYDRAGELEKRLSTRNSDDFRAATAARDSVKRLEKDLLAAQQQLITLRAEIDAGKAALQEAERKLKAVNAENAKSGQEVVNMLQQYNQLQQEVAMLRQLKEKFGQLQRDFNALTVENRENKLLAEAAKMRQAELERAKLLLLDNDRLKAALAKEQQFNSELRTTYVKDQQELRQLRLKATEFEENRRKIIELEAKAKEAERLKNVEQQLAVFREREQELVSLKISFENLQSKQRLTESKLAAKEKESKSLNDEIASLRKAGDELQKIRKTNRELEAIVNSQSAELKKFASNSGKDEKSIHEACRQEAAELRKAAAAVGPLNDQIYALQNQIKTFKKLYDETKKEMQNIRHAVDLKDKEIRSLQKLNKDLADYRKNSAGQLLDTVDASRITRLEDELTALNKLNAELAAERDKLAAILENRDKDPVEEVQAVQAQRSAEDLAGSGLAAEKSGKNELAIWNYKQAIANKPDFYPAHLRLGMIYFRRGSFAEAAGHLETAHNAAPENFQLAIDTARCFIAVSRFGNAKSIIDPLLKTHANNGIVQMCAALIEAGCGAPVRAEERLHTALRLMPDSKDIYIELARLLSKSVTDRSSEAVMMYEKARTLGAAPDPGLEKKLGTMLDHRRELVIFMSGAAREAEIGGDWHSAVWYYKKILEEKHENFVPLLAFAQWKSGASSAAKETLEFNKPSRAGMMVRTFIALEEKELDTAMQSAQQSAGVKLDDQWVGIKLEIEKLKKGKNLPPAAKILLKNISAQ